MVSIRWKLILSYVLLSVSTAVASGIISYALIRGFVRRESSQELKATAESIENRVRPLFSNPDSRQLESISESISQRPQPTIRILDHDRRPVAAAVTRPAAPPPRNDRISGLVRRIGTNDGGDDRVYTYPVRDDGTLLGYIELANPPDLATRTLARSKRYLLLAGTVAAACAIVIGFIIGGMVTSPLLALGSAVKRMEAGDLGVRARIRRRDEIGQLAGRVDSMADRIEETMESLRAERDALRAFVADASHELRTPLTALRTFVELLLADEQAPGRRREILEDSERQIRRLEWIVGSLLDLARIDGGAIELRGERVEIGDLLSSVVDIHSERAKSRGIEITVERPTESCVVTCDRRAIESAISNIVDNAVKYSSEGGTIDISCSCGYGQLSVAIADGGPGIDSADLPHIFERFYRSRQNSVEGSGLGLSLADSYVRAHGGHIDIDTAAGCGSTFTIVLPADRSASAASG